jgi:DNA-binding transcriptional ArsR family regulator
MAEPAPERVEALRELLLAPVDPVLADPTRFRVLAALAGLPAGGRLSFTTLRKLLELTDGNLGAHLHVLGEHGYADAARVSHGRRQQSQYAATAAGRAAFERHAAALATIIRAGRGAG